MIRQHRWAHQAIVKVEAVEAVDEVLYAVDPLSQLQVSNNN